MNRFTRVSAKAALLFMLLSVAFPISAQAGGNPGELDTLFGTNGSTTTNFGQDWAEGLDTAVLPNGKILVAGQTGTGTRTFGLAQLEPDGDLDPTFGSGGLVETSFGEVAADPNALIVMGNKIVLAGFAGDDFAVARYLSNGDPDNAFSGDGMTTIDFNGGDDLATGVVAQPDGKIVVAGRVFKTGQDGNFGLVRLKSNGGVDTTFGTNGKVSTDIGGRDAGSSKEDMVGGIARMTNGKLVVGGTADVGSGSPDAAAFAVARYSAKGKLDNKTDVDKKIHFGGDGIVTTVFGTGFDEAYIHAVAVQSDGKVVAGGSTFGGGPNLEDWAFARYNANGSLDTNKDSKPAKHFSKDGKAVLSPGGLDGSATDLLLKGQKVVAVGAMGLDFGLLQLKPNGGLDGTFSGDGIVGTDFLGDEDVAHAVAVDPTSNKLVLVGGAGRLDAAVARYHPGGTLDTDSDTDPGTHLSTDGRARFSWGGNNFDTAYDVAVAADNKIIAVGDTVIGAGDRSLDFQVARYTMDGVLDSTFGENGGFTLHHEGLNEHARAVAIQTDGKIVVVGESGLFEWTVFRLTTDGDLDLTFGGGDGIVQTDVPGNEEKANDVIILSSGKIVVGGTAGNDFVLTRYNSDGTLDTNSDADPGTHSSTDGMVATDIGATSFDVLDSLAQEADGKLVAGGTSGSNFALARYSADGVLDDSAADGDPAFDTDGKTTLDLGANDGIVAVAVQPDEKIVAAGTTQNGFIEGAFALTRYGTDGTLDTTSDSDPGVHFSTDGMVTTDWGTGIDPMRDMILVGTDILAVGGATKVAGFGQDMALARYEADGSPDLSFGGTGLIRFTTFLPAHAVATQVGKFIVFGGAIVDGDSDWMLTRFFH